MEIKSYEQIYDDMKNYIIANQDKLTDFNDGSVLASQVEAIARELLLLYIKCRIGFSTYLRSLPYSVFGFQMKEGVKASVKIKLSRARQFSYETPLAAGTTVTAGGLKFTTVEPSFVKSGEVDSPLILATAQSVGDRYNVPAGAINTIVSTLPADIVKVTNPAAATGGENSEDWASYVDRFADYIVGLQRTNSAGILTALSDLTRSVGFVEHFPPLNGWNLTLYLEDGSGSMSPEDMAEANKIIDGNIAQNISGYRPPGIKIRYLPPEIVPITTHVTVHTERDILNEVDQSAIAVQVTDEVRRYINSLKIGEPVLRSNITVLLKRLPALSNVIPTLPPEDIIIDKNTQIARFEDCLVTVVSK